VVAEVAIALVLLVGSGLLLRSFLELRRVDPGFRADHLLVVQLSPGEARYDTPERVVGFFDQVLGSVSSLGGIQAAALTSQLPMDEAGASMAVNIPGRPPAARREDTPVAFVRSVSTDYFDVIGIPLLTGRALGAADGADAPRVGVINQAMARRYWPQGDAVGQRITLDDDNEQPLEIVGVVADVRHFGLEAEPRPEVFVPYPQTSPALWGWTDRTMSAVIRSGSGSPPATLAPAVRGAIGAIDREVPIARVTTMEEILSQSVAAPRATLMLLGLFATLALLLASIGLYATMAFSVAQRTREIGVRMALGADRRAVLRLVVFDGLLLAMAGIAVGLAVAFGLTRLLASMLFGIAPTDPVTFAGVSLLLVLVAALACWYPARRAASVDPMTALRIQ
jgi:putative ABC transport system permease protein